MGVTKIKCLNCMEITSIPNAQLIPFEEKTISVKCSNPSCGKQMKVAVPKLSLAEKTGSKNILDLPPTQVIRHKAEHKTSAKLRVLKNLYADEQVFSLKEGKNKIGRLSLESNQPVPDVPIFTRDKKMSRNNHCEILLIRKENTYEVILKDNGSKNGTFLNNSKAPLSPDDEVYLNNREIFIIGETKIQLEFE